MARGRRSGSYRGLVQLELGLESYPQKAPTMAWTRSRCASRWIWRAGDPLFWCIEEPPESRGRPFQAAAHRCWLEREHPNRAGDWELWYSTPTIWLLLSFHPSLATAQEVADVTVADRARMHELNWSPQPGLMRGTLYDPAGPPVCSGCRRAQGRAPGLRHCGEGHWCTECRLPAWPCG